MADRYDPREIKERLPFLSLLSIEGMGLRRSGANFVMSCPFHNEKSPSFTVHAGSVDRGHCYGCGWDGDVIDFWMKRHDVTWKDAVARLASMASVAPSASFFSGKIDASQVPQMTEVAPKLKERPPLPRMRPLEEGEVRRLAEMRELRAEGVGAASGMKRVGACVWPQWQGRDGRWRAFDDSGVCWVVTDRERRVVQFRRLDGEMFTRKDGGKMKCWTKGSASWPLGAAEIGDRGGVLLVEGGADMLAAYHFLEGFGRLGDVAVCAMLGASMRIAEEGLGFFDRKRVRLIMDDDEAGCEAAARWTAQLVAAGAAVETFSLHGLMRRDGKPVKDLNDLAVVEEKAWIDEDLRCAFFDFDF